MDNDNIYDVVYSEETEINEEINNIVYDEPKRKRKRSSNGFGKYIAIMLLCSLLGGIIGSGITYTLTRNLEATTKNVVLNPATFATDSEALTATEVYNKVAPAVVIVSVKSITTYNGFFPQETEGIGSGFIINEEGYILTNYHVIEGATEVSVTLSDKTEVKASIVNYDQEQDVAMIKIIGDIEVPGVVELGDSDALQTGEEVLAIGTPLSKDLADTLTNGIVSALNRNVETSTGVTLNLIQTNAAINPGNSGGPLINTRGEVIGINTMKMMSEDVEGLGFAIPINDIKDKIESLSKPILNLGISVRTVDETLAKQLNMEEGLYIVEVTEFSAAERAGLKSGDLIVKMDGTRVKTFDELKKIKNSKEEGDIINIEVIRDGSTKTIELTLTAN